MRHRMLRVILAGGVIFGLYCGITSVVHHRHLHGSWHGHSHGFRSDRQAHFEQHVADICVQAALDAAKVSAVQKQKQPEQP